MEVLPVTWLGTLAAAKRAKVSIAALYRLGAAGQIRTRLDRLSHLEFCTDDLDILRSLQEQDAGLQPATQ